jgi:hypothetical protein
MRRDAGRSRWATGLSVAGAAAAALVCLALFVHLSQLYPKTSDQANFFLAGIDVADGNWRLKGWILASAHYWTSDVALSAVLATLWSMLGRPAASPFLLIAQPAIVWTMILASVLAMAWCRLASLRARLGAAAIILAVLFMPLLRIPVMYFITLSAIHLGTMLYCLAAFHIVDRLLTRSADPPPWMLAGCAVVICLGAMGDPLVVFVVVVPVVLTCLCLAALPARRRAAIAGAAIVAAVAAKLLMDLNVATGGFRTQTLIMQFVPFDAVATNVAVTLHCILQLFSADFFGAVPSHAAAELLHLPLMLAALAASVIPLRRLLADRTRIAPVPPLLVLLAFGAIVDALAVIVSDHIELEMSSPATSRYLFPLWIYLTLAAGIMFARSKCLTAIALLAIVVTAQANWPVYRGEPVGMLYSPEVELLTFLESHDLAAGIGPYWESSNLQFASLGRVTVYAGAADGNGKIVPYIDWRRQFSFGDLRGPTFFVIVGSTPPLLYTADDVLRTFGQPDEQHRVGIFTVFVYRHPPSG